MNPGSRIIVDVRAVLPFAAICDQIAARTSRVER